MMVSPAVLHGLVMILSITVAAFDSDNCPPGTRTRGGPSDTRVCGAEFDRNVELLCGVTSG